MYRHMVIDANRSKNLLEAARWLLETATKMNASVPFLPWNTASYYIQQVEHEWNPHLSDDDDDAWQSMQDEINAIPTPPKVGLRVTARHAQFMIEDIFHYSRIYLDEHVFSDSHIPGCQYKQSNSFVYAVALALRRMAKLIGDEEVCIEVVSFHDITAMQQDALTDWASDRKRYQKAGRIIRRSRRSN